MINNLWDWNHFGESGFGNKRNYADKIPIEYADSDPPGKQPIACQGEKKGSVNFACGHQNV